MPWICGRVSSADVPVRHRQIGGRINRDRFSQATRGQTPRKQGIGEIRISHGFGSFLATSAM
jgi:hypothetical protein